jgi:hypothetical protein
VALSSQAASGVSRAAYNAVARERDRSSSGETLTTSRASQIGECYFVQFVTSPILPLANLEDLYMPLMGLFHLLITGSLSTISSRGFSPGFYRSVVEEFWGSTCDLAKNSSRRAIPASISICPQVILPQPFRIELSMLLSLSPLQCT